MCKKSLKELKKSTHIEQEQYNTMSLISKLFGNKELVVVRYIFNQLIKYDDKYFVNQSQLAKKLDVSYTTVHNAIKLFRKNPYTTVNGHWIDINHKKAKEMSIYD